MTAERTTLERLLDRGDATAALDHYAEINNSAIAEAHAACGARGIDTDGIVTNIVPSVAGLTDQDALDLTTAIFGDGYNTVHLSPEAESWLDDFTENLSSVDALKAARDSLADLQAPPPTLAELAEARPSAITELATCVSVKRILVDAATELAEVTHATGRALTGPVRRCTKTDAPIRPRRYCTEHRPLPLDLLPINAHAPPTRPQAQDRPTSVGVTAVRGTQLRGSPLLS